MPGFPFMDQWQRDEIARAERLDADALSNRMAMDVDARMRANREAWQRHVEARIDARLARGHVRPESSDAAVWIVFGVAGVGAALGWIVAHGLLRAIEWLAGL
jgi:hypothetical protein